MRSLEEMERWVRTAADWRVSLIDSDTRLTATSGKNRRRRYNVHIAVGSEHHLIVVHEVKSAMIEPNSSRQAGKTQRYFTGCRRIAVENRVVVAPVRTVAERKARSLGKRVGCQRTRLADRSPKRQEAICFPP